tara:strand:+ start:987 stop:1409 length:423 start_codon:yes stop_codon:yes gene_type:complete
VESSPWTANSSLVSQKTYTTPHYGGTSISRKHAKLILVYQKKWYASFIFYLVIFFEANKTQPPVPKVEAEYLFWQMMSHSRDFDPWMYPALQALKKSGKYILAALSNTVIFPSDHPYSNPPEEKDIRRLFDVFVSSAHVG